MLPHTRTSYDICYGHALDCWKERREEYFLSWFFFLDTSVFLCLFLCRLEYIVDWAQVNVSVEEGRVDGVGKLVVDESPSAKPTADAPGQVNTPVGCTNAG